MERHFISYEIRLSCKSEVCSTAGNSLKMPLKDTEWLIPLRVPRSLMVSERTVWYQRTEHHLNPLYKPLCATQSTATVTLFCPRQEQAEPPMPPREAVGLCTLNSPSTHSSRWIQTMTHKYL